MTFDSRWKLPQGKTPEQIYNWAEQLIRELRKGDYLPVVDSLDADAIVYDNATSGLAATDVQAAIDEVEGRVDTLEALPDPGLVLLASGTVTAQATLDIPLTGYTGYRAIKVLLSSFVPVDDDTELWLRFSTDGGSNYDATGYSWSTNWSRDSSTSSVVNNSASSNQIRIAGSNGASESVSNTAAEGGVDTEIDLPAQTDTARWPRTRYSSSWFGAAVTDTFRLSGAASRETAQDTNAVRFLFETGNIASGSWAVYGYA
jgi:hypothetical protein